MRLQEKLSKALTGIAGEYYVAAELSMRGFMASVTLRNNERIDIHASKLSENKIDTKIFAIQVKTSQTKTHKWPLNKKAEGNKADNLFYVFVSFQGVLTRPEFYIVPSSIVADAVKNGHKEWLKKPGKKGQPHKNTDMRNFADSKGEYLERWDLLT